MITRLTESFDPKNLRFKVENNFGESLPFLVARTNEGGDDYYAPFSVYLELANKQWYRFWK